MHWVESLDNPLFIVYKQENDVSVLPYLSHFTQLYPTHSCYIRASYLQVGRLRRPWLAVPFTNNQAFTNGVIGGIGFKGVDVLIPRHDAELLLGT
jgi:hypothetical protein